ncbi:hypothetical protein [Pseudoxanthomonas mexicana]|jgi:hypothetical protein|uniref:hypothetical protein n=1 Tax=Pseudoxanthomonas mexicana TaxID=128785 RepID=UPI00398A7B2D
MEITLQNPSLRALKLVMRANIQEQLRERLGDRRLKLGTKTHNIVRWVGYQLYEGSDEELQGLQATLEECLAFVLKEQRRQKEATTT